MNKTATIAALLLLLSFPCGLAAGIDFAPLCADRAAIERVYHEHRTGTKPPFEEAMPPALLERLVREDAKKEAVLARAYGVKITGEMVAAEVERINTTTRAPEMLAEIKAALGHDAARFARAMARPFVVERALRARFENDDALHAPQRRAAESVRGQMLATKEGGFDARLAALKQCKDGEVQEQVKWEVTPRPADDAAPSPPATLGATQGKASSGTYRIEATAQVAQVLSSPEKTRDEKERKFYFEDLPGDLQNVLRVQLLKSGDVSAVIESPRAFQVYLARERTAAALSVAVLTIPKRSYEDWLAQQPEP